MKAFLADRVSPCGGPHWSGRCPLADPGQPVACAGHAIMLVDDEGRKVAVLSVEADAAACPIAGLGVTGPAPSGAESRQRA